MLAGFRSRGKLHTSKGGVRKLCHGFVGSDKKIKKLFVFKAKKYYATDFFRVKGRGIPESDILFKQSKVIYEGLKN